jgi:RNA polymerase sigma factor (TIGR02999 family)
MRRILIDYARAQERDKRGGGAQHLQLTDLHDLAATDWRPIPFLDLDAALNELAELSPRQQQVVELRYFGGLELDEVAEVLGISERTIVRDWNAARAWLLDKLQNSASSPESSGAGH